MFPACLDKWLHARSHYLVEKLSDGRARVFAATIGDFV
jgi:hypothetical protein